MLIFNKSGRVLKGFKFFLNGIELEVAESYQYLGIKVRPSGSFTAAAEELSAKARRAWTGSTGRTGSAPSGGTSYGALPQL